MNKIVIIVSKINNLKVTEKRVGDPAKRTQNFIDIPLKVLCCRYWYLNIWDCHDMAFPFWRVYWNRNSGGLLKYNTKIYKMKKSHLYVISPFSPFSTRHDKNHRYDTGIHVSGANVAKDSNEKVLKENHLLHFFVHFNLGAPLDHVLPEIYEIKLTKSLKTKLKYLTHRLKIENTDFKITFNLKLQSFIKEVISKVGPQLWKTINIDKRVMMVHRHIEKNISKKLNNSDLASVVYMAPNSFARLFKKEMNLTLHQFIQKRKIAKACELIEHSEGTIESIAFELGFSDRYHFSRVFKNITGVSPGAFYKSNKIS